MTYSKTEDKQTLLLLSAGETQDFEAGKPVKKQTGFRRGLVEIVVSKVRTCPTPRTLEFLQDVLIDAESDKPQRPDFKKSLEAIRPLHPSKATVDDVVQALATTVPFFAFMGLIHADLVKFQQLIGGEVPIADIVAGD